MRSVSFWYILFAILLLFGFQDVKAGDSKKAQELVNKHLVETQNSMEQNKAKVKVENFHHLQPFNSKRKTVAKPISDVDLSQEDPSKFLPQDTTPNYVSPSQETYEAMGQAQQDERDRREYERQFVKEFKKNAEKSGYRVQIDQNLQVRGVQSTSPAPSRQPQSVSEENSSSGSSAGGH